MTQITLASKDSTPQRLGPFHITHADVGANYAAGFPLFTPNPGDYILAAWAMVTVAWVGDGLTVSDNFLVGAGLTVEGGSAGSTAPPGLSAAGAAVRAYNSGGSGYSAGEADLYVLVAPVPVA